MGNLDSWLHIIGLELLLILGCVWRLSQKASIKRRTGQAFVLVRGFMLAHAVTHWLPDAMAHFIYSSSHHLAPINVWRDRS